MKWIKITAEDWNQSELKRFPVLFYIKTDHKLSRGEEGDISGEIGGDLGDIEVSLTEVECTDDGSCVYEVEGFLSTSISPEDRNTSDVEMAMGILAEADRNLGKNIVSIGQKEDATNDWT